MKLMKLAPPIGVARRDVDALFDRLFRMPFFPEVPTASVEPTWEPALDLTEGEKEFVLRVEAPGFHRENLDVKYDNGVLTVTGTREFRNEFKGEEFLWQERNEGRFLRAIRIPAPVVEDKVEALYENGVLLVRLPKLQPFPKARIAIK
jgi:HSP20 family protein